VKLFFASDLHVDTPGNGDFVKELAAVAIADRPDVLVIAGDVCNGVAELARILALFGPAAQQRIYVPGNHELWARTGDATSARERYYKELPRIARAAGFHPLTTEPFIAGDVGFVGTMAWYDYSFADPSDGYSASELASKSRDGLEWMDGRFVKWTDADGRRMTDAEVTAILADDLSDQLDAIADAPLRSVVLVTHHLAFLELCPPVFVDGHLKFFRAFLGSERFGEIAAREPRLRLALAGHVHSVRTFQTGDIVARTCPVGYPRERQPGVTPADRRILLEV
jgi:3',5'-cyclic AMP phosphodiesterase CpdA